jgi:hypothetical protein
VLDKNKIRMHHHVFTEDKLHNTNAQLKASPKKSFHQLGLETVVSNTSAHTAAKLFQLCPYKVRVIQKRTLSYRLRSKKPVLQMVSRTGKQQMS